ncbi:MAG: hypothetical protein IJA31_00975 [Clostridia bacterium]|nr:hypothetical protein [Clostridia bacterium]
MKRKIKDYLFAAFIFLFAVWLLATAFYTHGNMTEENTQSCSVEIMSAENDYTHRKTWLILQTADSETFYCRTDLLPKEARTAVDQMLENTTFPASATVSYTMRKDLLPTNFIEFTDYKRMVSLSVNGNCVIGLEQYNRENTGVRIGFIVISVICILIGFAFLWLDIIRWKQRRDNKKKRRDRK